MFLLDSGCQYAILSNGQKSILIRRTPLEPDVLFISEAFSNSSLTDTLSIVARYTYFCCKAYEAAPIPFVRLDRSYSPSPADDKNRETDHDSRHLRRSKRLKTNAANISLESTNQQESTASPSTPDSILSSSVRAPRQLVTHRIFHWGNHCTVREADFDGRKVVAKISYPDEEAIQIVRQEGETYKILKQLQGKTIPRVFAHFTDELGMYVIVMERLLKIETWTDEVIDKACASLKALNLLGYAQWDVSRSNFMQDEHGNVFVIDLEQVECRVGAILSGDYTQTKKFLRSGE